QKGLGACHSLAHPLSSEHGLHHGLANALCLPAVLEFNAEAVPARVQRIADLLGPGSENCAVKVRALRERVGLPNGLGAVKIKAEDLPPLAEKAVADACHRENPRPCTQDDLLKLYRAAL